MRTTGSPDPYSSKLSLIPLTIKLGISHLRSLALNRQAQDIVDDDDIGNGAHVSGTSIALFAMSGYEPTDSRRPVPVISQGMGRALA
jgi:hypothetical protein